MPILLPHNNIPGKHSPVTDWFDIDSRNTLESLMLIFDGMVFRCGIDEAWTMLLIGGGCVALTGYEPHQLLGNRLLSYNEITHPDDRNGVNGVIHEAIRYSKPYRIEYRIRCRDGKEKWVTERGASFADEHGVQVLQGFIEDITSEVAARTSLVAVEARYHSIFENSAEGIFQTTVDGHYLTANPALARIYGYDSPTELMAVMQSIGTQLYVDPMRRDDFRRLMHEFGSMENFESEVRRRDGTVIWIAESSRAVWSSNGEFLYYEGTVRNITARKNSEEQLRIAAAAFNSQEAMIVTDTQGVILRVNRAFTEITGYTDDEAIGQTPRLLKSGLHDADFYHQMWESIHRAGGWQGEVWGRRKDGEIYPKWLTISVVKDENGVVTHYVGSHSDITERKKGNDRIYELAFFDPLTGLANRTLLQDRLRQTMTTGARSGSYGALLFIDLDNFKILNDTLGHDIGDQLLKQVAQRLKQCVREGDTVARLGGDEFVLVLTSLSQNEGESGVAAERVAEKILALFNPSYSLGDVAYRCTASIGVTLFRGHQTSLEDLMKQADLAMYKSKEAGRNTLRFFDPAMEAAITKRVELETDLRAALQEQQFLLHYQPQVSGEGRLTGAEVLVRWQHPLRGMVSPAEFIPLAEETGLILPLGNWVLETACNQLSLWATRPEMEPLTVAVNVSARQFSQGDFVDQVLAVLEKTGANPNRLKLELTESLLVGDVEAIIEKMVLLKTRGVGFSLDDFGTGYSSLSYLKLLPLDQLKIDQSFVRDVLNNPNDAAIAKTIVALAYSLGLGVIAEGVETSAQRDFLASAGCHAYQGYFFSRPLPLKMFDEFAEQKTV